MNVAGIIDGHPDEAVALVAAGRTVTYGQLRRDVSGVQAGFADLGLDVGDRIGIVAANTIEFVLGWLAAARGGFVGVPLNPGSPGPELAGELAAVGARAVVCGPDGVTVARDLDRSEVPVLEHVIDPERLAELAGHEPAPAVDREAADLAVLMFTSGTAGSPRAAMLTHGNLLANLEQVQASEGRRRGPDDVALAVLAPLPHLRPERGAGRRPDRRVDRGAHGPLRRRGRPAGRGRARRHRPHRPADHVGRAWPPPTAPAPTPWPPSNGPRRAPPPSARRSAMPSRSAWASPWPRATG